MLSVLSGAGGGGGLNQSVSFVVVIVMDCFSSSNTALPGVSGSSQLSGGTPEIEIGVGVGVGVGDTMAGWLIGREWEIQ